MTHRDRSLRFWLAAGVAGFVLVPWYGLPDSVVSSAWLRALATREDAPALLQALLHGRLWLLGVGALLAAACVAAFVDRAWRGDALLTIGAAGLAYCFGQAFAITQPGMGAGATLVAGAFAFVLAQGMAER